MRAIEGWFRRRFVALHGEGAAHLYDFYRCVTCGKLITWKKIRSGEVCCSNRLTPGEPTWWETVKLFLLPWAV